jgi:predicted nuclease with TOPRIM domain
MAAIVEVLGEHGHSMTFFRSLYSGGQRSVTIDREEEIRDTLIELRALLQELQEENEQLRAEVKRLRKPSWRERLIRWIDTEPEGGNV